MSKKVWLTWLPAGEDAPTPDEDLGKLIKCGFAANGARWNDNLEKHGWSDLGGQLADPESADIWVIAGRQSDLENARIRYGLSLVTVMVRELRGKKQPLIAIVGLDYAPDAETFPTFLRQATCLEGAKGNWAAKLLVKSHGKTPSPPTDTFRMNLLAHEYFGQWFEIGPREGEWEGVMFGVSGEGSGLQEHAVGPAGDLPEKTTLNYATNGIKAEVGGSEFECCSVQNKISTEDSYWVQVNGHPSKLIFGSHPGSDQQEVWVLQLS